MTSTFDEQVGQAFGVAAPEELTLDQEQPGSHPRPGVGRGGRLRGIARELRVRPTFLLATAFIVIVLGAALFAPLVTPYDPNEQEITNTFQTPTAAHWLGTDDLGRDNLTRLVYGARTSLQAVFFVVLLALIVAIPIGTLAGHKKGKLDLFVMRITDVFSSIPPLVLAIVLATVIGVNAIFPQLFIPGLARIIIALAIIQTPTFIRLIRAQTLSVSAEPFIEASRSIGVKTPTIIRRHLIPNISSSLVVQISVAAGSVMLAEAALSYIGVGVAAPNPSWGSMLQVANQFILVHAWLMWIPGTAIALTVLCFFVIGEGLQDALGLQTVETRRGKSGRLGLTTARVEHRVPGDPATAELVATEREGIVAAQPAHSGNGDAVAVDTAVGWRDSAPDLPDALLHVQGLTIEFDTPDGVVRVVDGVSLKVRPGEVLGLVGESGSGKSVTVTSIMRLLPSPPAVVSGSIVFDGQELLSMTRKQMREIRGRDIAMVFQDPMSALNPAFTIGNQLVEAIRLHQRIPKAAARRRAIELLERTAIPDPERRMKAYPHELSGGMRQRALIAMALACDAKLLIADEPTTALDVTVQAQILELLKALQRDLNLAMIFVTHDLGVVADLCDRVAVMYAGQIVEAAPTHELFASPQHPYTEGLLASIPQPGEKLLSIAGQVPLPNDMPVGCRFEPRCPYADDACRADQVALVSDESLQRWIRCVHSDELSLEGTK